MATDEVQDQLHCFHHPAFCNQETAGPALTGLLNYTLSKAAEAAVTAVTSGRLRLKGNDHLHSAQTALEGASSNHEIIWRSLKQCRVHPRQRSAINVVIFFSCGSETELKSFLFLKVQEVLEIPGVDVNQWCSLV